MFPNARKRSENKVPSVRNGVLYKSSSHSIANSLKRRAEPEILEPVKPKREPRRPKRRELGIVEPPSLVDGLAKMESPHKSPMR